MRQLQPRFWFSAHLHVKYNHVIQHPGTEGEGTTEFLSLDKPLPKRQYLDVFEIGKDTRKLESIFGGSSGGYRPKMEYRPK